MAASERPQSQLRGLSVAVLVPVLNRPERIRPLLESLASEPRAFPVFLVSPEDEVERAALEQAAADGATFEAMIVSWPCGQGDYARKINAGYENAGADWYLLGADDLRFHPGWFDACLAVHDATGACVIGTNDLGNSRVMSGQHATHSLVHTDYRECRTIDGDDVLLHAGYWHNFVDNEFVETARWRGTFAFAADAHVEHEHPHWKKAAMDATYERGQSRFEDDRVLHRRRSRLWAR